MNVEKSTTEKCFNYFAFPILFGIILFYLLNYFFQRNISKHEDQILIGSENYDQLVKGLIAYKIPDSMGIYNNYKANVSITKAINDSILFRGSDENNFYYEKEEIEISSRVKVKLFDPEPKKNFEITALSTEEQLVDDSSNTVWNWNIKPIRSGENVIILRATVKILDRLGENYKDIRVFEKKIKVKASFLLTSKQFIEDYWQYLTTAIFIPLFIIGYNKIKGFIIRRKPRRIGF
jgi:hypothetical protein